MVIWIGAAGIIASVGLACALAIIEVRRSNRIVKRAQRIADLGTYQRQILDDSPVAYWPLGEVSGAPVDWAKDEVFS